MKRHGEIIMSYLWNNFQVTVDIDESGWEGVLLHHEEIDQTLISEEKLTGLPDSLLFHMTTYEDEKGNEWLFALALLTNDVLHLYFASYILNQELLTNWILNLK